MRAVSKIEYPYYSTNSKKLKLSKDCLANPFNEFVEFSMRTYYPNLIYSEVSMEDYSSMTLEDRVFTIKSILGDYGTGTIFAQGKTKAATVVNGNIGSDSIDIIKDGDVCCNVAILDDESYYIDKRIDMPKYMIKVTFKENDSLSYIVNDLGLNEFVFAEITQQELSKNQINDACAIIAGILNVNDYIKFHKMNAIKMNTISSYLSGYPELMDKLFIVYNYDSAYLTYSSEEAFDIVEVKYDNYINDIDKLLDKYGY